jgi:hypothetical protein
MVIVQIVEGVKMGGENFPGVVEMAQIGAGKMLAAITTAGFIHGARVTQEFGPFDVDLSLGGEERARAGVPSRQDTVE